MALTNSEVAQRFVKGLPGKGSNTWSRECPDGWEFISYSTPVAYIRDGRLFIDTNRYSNSTARQVAYIIGAWGYDKEHTYVPNIYEGGSAGNASHYLREAKEALEAVVKPRIMMKTRANNWNVYLSRMATADKVLDLPCYGIAPYEAWRNERYVPINAAREGLNPTGLGEFDNDLLLRVKAICALEGEGT